MKVRLKNMIRRFDLKKHGRHDIEKLVDRFFSGDTTLDEEKMLYRYFAQPSLPPHLERYRELFADFSAMSGEPVAKRKSVLKGHWRAVAGVAAAVAVLLCVSIYADMRERHLLAKAYSGSYVVVDGKRIDDLVEIKDEIQVALGEAEKIEKVISGPSVVERVEQDVLSDIDDPEARKRINEILND